MMFLVDGSDTRNSMRRRRHRKVLMGAGHRLAQRHNFFVAENPFALKVRHVLLRLVVIAEVRTVAAAAGAESHAHVLVLLRAENLLDKITADSISI